MLSKEKLEQFAYQVKKLSSREKAILKNDGLMPFVKSLAGYTRKVVLNYSWHYLYEEVLDSEIYVPPHRVENLEVRELHIPTMTQFDYEALDEQSFDFEKHPDVRDYVPRCGESPQTGIVMLYATSNGEFVHRNAATLTADGTYYGKFQKRLRQPFYSLEEQGTIYRVLCVTNPKFRGKGIYAHLEYEMHNFLRSKGYRKLVYSCDPDMIFDLHIFDTMGCDAKYKLYQIKMLALLEYIWSEPCLVQPLDERGIKRKNPRNHYKDIGPSKDTKYNWDAPGPGGKI